MDQFPPIHVVVSHKATIGWVEVLAGLKAKKRHRATQMEPGMPEGQVVGGGRERLLRVEH